MTKPDKRSISYATPVDDLCDQALKHYDATSEVTMAWLSTIKNAINFYRKKNDVDTLAVAADAILSQWAESSNIEDPEAEGYKELNDLKAALVPFKASK